MNLFNNKFDTLYKALIKYHSITEELVMSTYHESAVDIIFERTLEVDHASICLASAKVILLKKRIPDKYATLLLEPFKNKFVPKPTYLPINTFARLRLMYDLSLVCEPKKVIHERYKTLAIMTDPKMNVIKHTLEMWLLNVLSWRS